MSRTNCNKKELLNSLVWKMRQYGTRTVLFHQNIANSIGVAHTDFKTANILNETGPITAGELAKITGLSTGTVTSLVDRLEKAGIVKRESDQNDRRRVVIVPIKEKQEQIKSHYVSLGEVTKKECASYSEEEMELIIGFMTKAIAILEQENERLTKE